eukprot:g2861.t1
MEPELEREPLPSFTNKDVQDAYENWEAKSRDEKMDFLLSIPMRKDQPTTDEIGKRVDTVLVELHTEFGIAARIAISRRMKQPCELSWSRQKQIPMNGSRGLHCF